MRNNRIGPLVAVLALVLLFVWRATIDLANVRTVSGDEAIILSITERLLLEHRLATPMLEGFRGADDHYFVVLPGQNVWQLPFVWALGMDVAAARLASVLAAALTILLTAILARRWFDAPEALLAALLLVVWRSGLVDMDFGLPLLSVARSARYDISVVAWMCASVLLLDLWLERPARWRAAAAGAAAGCAALTQFLGVFILPALLVAMGIVRPLRAGRFALWLLIGFTAVLLPYAVFVAAHASDAAAQFSISHAARLERGFGGLTAPLASALREPQRFLSPVRFTGLGPWLFVLGAIPAFVLCVRAERADRRGATLLIAITVAIAIQLALLEPTKAAVYGLALYPFVCIAMAHTFTWLWFVATNSHRRIPALMAGAVLCLVVAEGIAVYVHDARVAPRLAHYDAVGRAISAAAPSPGSILGATRWWWALRSRAYTPFWSAEMRWENTRAVTGTAVPFAEVVRGEGIGYVLDTAELRADAARAHTSLGVPLTTILDVCGPATPIGDFPGYGRISLIEVDEACLQAAAPSKSPTPSL